jgi:hypothetical protein
LAPDAPERDEKPSHVASRAHPKNLRIPPHVELTGHAQNRKKPSARESSVGKPPGLIAPVGQLRRERAPRRVLRANLG